jgi:mannose-1-phosphate guanylyltransferase/mannose-6-phosphate isomerase
VASPLRSVKYYNERRQLAFLHLLSYYTNPMITPVILAGGAGTRLWPISRQQLPKQFAPLFGEHEKTLFQLALQRIQGLPGVGDPIVVCNTKHRAMAQQQLAVSGFKNASIILEQQGKGTAPAAAIAAILTQKKHPDSLLLVLPADHFIPDIKKFHQAINTAKRLAQAGDLLCFGVTPQHPETGYGYIQVGKKLPSANAFVVAQFVEKPNLKLAQKYLASKKYLWNAGIFMFAADSYLRELAKYAPDIIAVCEQTVAAMKSKPNLLKLSPKYFAKCRSDSIDYAVMEHTKNAKVVALTANWSDVGSWEAMWKHSNKDLAGNVIKGKVVAHDVANSYLHASQRRIVAIGVSDHIIIETADTILVLPKNQSQLLSKIVAMLE